VVTNLKAGRIAMGAATLRRSGDAMLRLIVRENMVMGMEDEGRWVEDGDREIAVAAKTAPRHLRGSAEHGL
jgi:hypothetical protein